MLNLENAISRDDFFERLNKKFQGVYNAEGSFSLIVLEAIPADNNLTKDVFVEAINALSREITMHLSKESDFFAFWENKFFIYSMSDSKDKIRDFINFILLIIEREYKSCISLKVGFAQYPYDAIEIEELMDVVRENTKIYSKADTSLSNIKNTMPKLGRNNSSNMEIINEVHGYLNKLSNYDDYLFEHSLLVAQGSVFFAKELGFDSRTIKNIATAAILHDIGYMKVPLDILKQKGKLSAKDWGLIKIHPILATRNILKDNDVFRDVLHIIEQHHEFLDGSGYPFGLKTDEICIEAQVISMLDTYQAVMTNRSYRRALSIDEAVDIFLRNAGIKWEEDLVTIFLALLGDKKARKRLTDNNYKDISEIFDIS